MLVNSLVKMLNFLRKWPSRGSESHFFLRTLSVTVPGNVSSIPTPSTSTPPPEASWRALSCSQPPTITSDESTMSARPPTGLRERERRKVGKGGEKRREMVSGLGGRQGRVRRSEEKVCKACCVCSGKPGPAPPAANAVLFAGKKTARGFDRVSTYHQKITA